MHNEFMYDTRVWGVIQKENSLVKTLDNKVSLLYKPSRTEKIDTKLRIRPYLFSALLYSTDTVVIVILV